MKNFSSIILSLVIAASTLAIPAKIVHAADQTLITRSQAEQRAIQMIDLNWTYSKDRNGNIDPKYAGSVTLPQQLQNVTTAQMTGIPYDWGGIDAIDTYSYNAPWTSFLDAVSKGAFTGNVNSDGGLGYVTGTAGVDCSGFVQAAFNIKDYKQSTSTLFDNYFTKINLSDLKHMDILDKPGDHVVIFDKWGSLNGLDGAFTYEATTDQFHGGIQGAKRYFISMNTINKGYIPGRYKYVVDDPVTPAPTPVPEPTPAPAPAPAPAPQVLKTGSYAQITNVTTSANFRSNPSTTATLLGTIPKGAIVYITSYSSGWYQVKYNSQTGWVYGNLLAAVPSNTYVTVNNVYQLNIRSNASSTSSIIGVLTQGQYAKVFSISGSWYQISINGIQGYAYGSYLKYIQ